jgi:hypothetical protein
MELKNVIKEKIFKGRKSRSGKTFREKKLAGCFIAGVFDGEVGIGFSLCHKNDRYDFIKGIRQPGFGEKMAEGRAIKSAQTGRTEIPPSLMKKARKFVNRCERYYKGEQIAALFQQQVEFPETRSPRLFIQTRDRVRTVEEV